MQQKICIMIYCLLSRYNFNMQANQLVLFILNVLMVADLSIEPYSGDNPYTRLSAASHKRSGGNEMNGVLGHDSAL